MKNVFLLLLFFIFSACSTIHYNREQVLTKQDSIKHLSDKLEEARVNDVDFLSPTHFNNAKEKFEQAIKKSQHSNDVNAGENYAKEGLEELNKAIEIAEKSKKLLEKTLEYRTRAFKVYANVVFEHEFKKLEDKFKKVGRYAEKDDVKYVNEQNQKLAKAYGDLEVNTLKKTIGDRSKEAYNLAIAANADKLAPTTLEKAKHEMEIAAKILENEKDSFEKAENHAKIAASLALRAKGIADIINTFKTQNLSREQIILWYQDQLTKAHSPIPQELSFDKSNFDVIENFKNQIASSLDYAKNLEQRSNEAQAKINELNEKISSAANEAEKARLAEAHKIDTFKEVSNLFTKEEAEVIAQEGKIIIRSYGFDFPVGKAEILPSNFPLLNKISSAILKFPHSNIEVEGHTDSSGSHKINKELSEERAKNVRAFLVNVSGIDSSRITSAGFGSQKPVAANDTKEGRAKNRRIEIVIFLPAEKI